MSKSSWRSNVDSAKSFHQRYLDIWKVLRQRDKELGETFDDLRRSTAFTHIAAMKARGLLTEDEFSRFSQEIRDIVALLLGS